eukprot:10453534-Karenia_brevis.AAC.1
MNKGGQKDGGKGDKSDGKGKSKQVQTGVGPKRGLQAAKGPKGVKQKSKGKENAKTGEGRGLKG